MFPQQGNLTHLVRLVRGEYLEMPGLRLTKAQAQRLWGLDAPTCDKVIKTLVSARFLRRTPTDSYARVDLEY
jgi:hypothetical protein